MNLGGSAVVNVKNCHGENDRNQKEKKEKKKKRSILHRYVFAHKFKSESAGIQTTIMRTRLPESFRF